MRVRDLDQVCAIENTLFQMAWSRQGFEHEVTVEPSSLCLVVEDDGAVVGYFVSWLVIDELHIGNVAVTPGRQGQGIGKDLIREGLREAHGRGASIATLEVRMSNERAIALYERFGFRFVAIRRRYYSDNGEDALVMMRELPHEEVVGE
jgi:ribosomal-protein-alanine N-acetyltransferase